MFNQITLLGRLTAAPELRYTESGKAYCNFSLAVERDYKDSSGEKPVDFFNIVSWGKQAENCAEYLRRGSLVMVCGGVHNRSYTDKNGAKRYSTEVQVSKIKFVSHPKGEEKPSPRDEDAPPFGPEAVGEDDLPF